MARMAVPVAEWSATTRAMNLSSLKRVAKDDKYSYVLNSMLGDKFDATTEDEKEQTKMLIKIFDNSANRGKFSETLKLVKAEKPRKSKETITNTTPATKETTIDEAFDQLKNTIRKQAHTLTVETLVSYHTQVDQLKSYMYEKQTEAKAKAKADLQAEIEALQAKLQALD